jgi:hypothetical protein
MYVAAGRARSSVAECVADLLLGVAEQRFEGLLEARAVCSLPRDNAPELRTELEGIGNPRPSPSWVEWRATQRGVTVAVWLPSEVGWQEDEGGPRCGRGREGRAAAGLPGVALPGPRGGEVWESGRRSGGSGAGLRWAALIGGLGGKVPEDLRDHS